MTESIRQSRRTLLEWGVVSLSSILFGAAVVPHMFALDDPYIALHSARVVLSGHDPVFGSPALTGVTSPAYVAILVAFLRLGFSSGAEALRLACVAGFGVYVSAIWAMTDRRGMSLVTRTACTVIGACSGLTLVNAMNGLETGWAMGILAWLVVAVDRRRLWWSALLAGLLPFFRPDLAPAAGLLFVASIWRETWAARAASLLAAAAIAAPLLLWVHSNTGDWMPATMQAKALFYAEGCLPTSEKLRLVGQSGGRAAASLFPLILALGGLVPDRIGRIGLAAIGIGLIAYAFSFPTSLAYNYSRYFYALVAPWCCWGLMRIVDKIPAPAAKAGTASLALTTLVYLATAGWVNQEAHRESWNVAEWLTANVDPDAVLLVHDAGVISEAGNHRAADFVGLKTPSSIAAHARYTWPSCGADRARAVAEVARTSGASYLVVNNLWDVTFHLSDRLPGEGLSLTKVRPLSGPDGYVVYRLK